MRAGSSCKQPKAEQKEHMLRIRNWRREALPTCAAEPESRAATWLKRTRARTLVVDHELRGHLRHLLSHQPVLPRLRLVELGLVIERHRAQLHQHVAFLIHVGDRVLEAARGGGGAELAGGIDVDSRADGAGLQEYPGDECRRLGRAIADADGIRAD